jgi:hypothetical protein
MRRQAKPVFPARLRLDAGIELDAQLSLDAILCHYRRQRTLTEKTAGTPKIGMPAVP